eukprot:scaffold206933_cov48-Prasinocladus_malaysianus.AAC.1
MPRDPDGFQIFDIDVPTESFMAADALRLGPSRLEATYRYGTGRPGRNATDAACRGVPKARRSERRAAPC